MTNTIAAVMRHLRNFFERGRIEGEISITGGVVSPSVEAPYIYIKGSRHHDGLRQMADSAIVGDAGSNETFAGCVWLLYPPDDFLDLCAKIAEFEAKTPAGALQSESLEGYSYTRASGQNGLLTWQEAFATRLTPFRRTFTEVG